MYYGFHILICKILSNVIIYFRSPSSPSLTTVTINSRSNTNSNIHNKDSLISLNKDGLSSVDAEIVELLNNKPLKSDSDNFIIENPTDSDEYDYYEDYYEAAYEYGDDAKVRRKRLVKKLVTEVLNKPDIAQV